MSRSARRLIWGGALVLLAADRALRALGQDDETAAYRVGSALGAVAGALVLAAALWWAGTRIARRGRPVTSPWVAAIAVILAGLVTVSTAARRVEEENQVAEAAKTCRVEGRFEHPPADRAYAPLDPKTEREIASGFGKAAEAIELRTIREKGEDAGLAMLFAHGGESDEFESGVLEGAREQGGTIGAVRIAGRRATAVVTSDNAYVVATSGCVSAFVSAPDVATARRLAEPLLRPAAEE